MVIKLRDNEKANYATKYNLERLIKKYSNFVGFPITCGPVSPALTDALAPERLPRTV